MITIGLVDDQQLVRAGFAMVINSQDDLSVTWQAPNGAAAIQQCRIQPVDVILMDIRMPGIDGIEATKQILETQKNTRIIVLTTFDSDDYIVDSILAGASGFLLKDAEPEDLLHSIRIVAEGESVLAPTATAKLLRRVRPILSEPTSSDSALSGRRNAILEQLPDPLTPREEEILVLIAQGLSNTEIAQELFISMPTVKTHVGHILAKTGSRDRVQAVLFAFKTGLIPQDDLLSG